MMSRQRKITDPNYRSWMMSKIRSKNTMPEKIVRSYLYKKGIRYRCHVRDLPGKPDIAIKKYKIAIQINGCFWHGCLKCNRSNTPKSNKEYWINKIVTNKKRDAISKKKLLAMRYKVLTLWECEINKGSYSSSLDKFVNLYKQKS